MSTQTQIDSLGERMDLGFGELKEMLLRFEERLRLLETREAGCSPIMAARMEAAMKRLDHHTAEIKALADGLASVSKMVMMFETIFKWLLGIATAVIVSVLIGLVK